MWNPNFTPAFKRMLEQAIDAQRNKPANLLGLKNQLENALKLTPQHVEESVKTVFDALADHNQKEQHEEGFANLTQILEFVAKFDEGLKEEANEIQDWLKKDATHKNMAYQKLLELFRNPQFAKFCAELIYFKPNTVEENLAQLNKRRSDENNAMNDNRRIQTEYGEGYIGMLLVNLIFTALETALVKAGYEVPGSKSNSNSNPDSQSATPRLVSQGPGKPPIILNRPVPH